MLMSKRVQTFPYVYRQRGFPLKNMPDTYGGIQTRMSTHGMRMRVFIYAWLERFFTSKPVRCVWKCIYLSGNVCMHLGTFGRCMGVFGCIWERQDASICVWTNNCIFLSFPLHFESCNTYQTFPKTSYCSYNIRNLMN